MPVINPSLVPTIAPGGIFTALTTDDTLNIRWLTATDPVFYEVLNRPHADIVLRQLILAKALDTLSASLGKQTIFPFIIQPKIASGSGDIDVPQNWIWDIHMSLPKKWENLRLAKIKRVSGSNDGSDGYTGVLRLIFTGTEEGSAVETALLYADFTIDSTLTYQLVRMAVVTAVEESTPISPSESETVAGFCIFRTLDTTDLTIQNFLDTVEPPTDISDLDSDGEFDNPAVYELIDSTPGDPAGDFAATPVSHGTGMLLDSAWNAIPPLDSDIQSWVNAFNYPYDADANRTSTTGVIIPLGMFREFDISVPAGDQPTGDVSGTFYPVWVSRIERTDDTSNDLRFYFATHNVTDTDTGGTPSTEPVEFATLDLSRDMAAGEIVDIMPISNLKLATGADATLFGQHFGRGHVVLSSVWGATSTAIDDFFDAFALISDDPPDMDFTLAGTRLSSFALSRVPKYSPTIGQAQALFGTAARFTTPVNPSWTNRFVNEKDEGLGNQIDMEAQPGIDPNSAIERFGNAATSIRHCVKLIVDSTQVDDSDTTFYDNEVLPRLRILFGRDPIFGDMWYNGTRFMFYNGNTWQG